MRQKFGTRERERVDELISALSANATMSLIVDACHEGVAILAREPLDRANAASSWAISSSGAHSVRTVGSPPTQVLILFKTRIRMYGPPVL